MSPEHVVQYHANNILPQHPNPWWPNASTERRLAVFASTTVSYYDFTVPPRI